MCALFMQQLLVDLLQVREGEADLLNREERTILLGIKLALVLLGRVSLIIEYHLRQKMHLSAHLSLESVQQSVILGLD